jgi:hypothetical protein
MQEPEETPVSEPVNELDGVPTRTDWHALLGGVQQPLLTPVDISVQTEPLVTQKPHRIDLLLLRRKGKFWTPQQQARLPDGIRQSRASHVLIEFKYTESVNENSLLQSLLYDHSYFTARTLRRGKVQTFLVSARTPRKEVLDYFEYEATELSGVYHSRDKFLKKIDLLLLNELSNQPHNVFFKCFASQKKQREAAFAVIERLNIWNWSEELWTTLSGLHSVFQQLEGATPMKEIALTPEYLRKLGEGMRQQIIATLSPAQRLEGLAPAQRLEGLAPAQRLEGLDAETVLTYFAPEQLLEKLDPAVIEEYLRQRQQAEDAPARRIKAGATRRKTKRT